MALKHISIKIIIFALLLYPVCLRTTLPYNTDMFLSFLCLGYLFGSFPTGYLLMKFFYRQDIRNQGSGSTGATNVLRKGGTALGIITLLLDALKVAAPVAISSSYSLLTPPHLYSDSYIPLLVACAAVLGHIFPFWLNFKGGKGVAPGLGALVVLSLPTAIFGIIVWILSAIISRRSSLSSLITSILIPVYSYFVAENRIASYFGMIMAVVLLITHRDNIQRLTKGTEPIIGQ